MRYTVNQVVRATGITSEFLRALVRDGALTAKLAKSLDTERQTYHFSPMALIAAAMIESLRKKGAPASLARKVGRYVSEITTDDLQAACDADQVFLASSGESVPAGFYDRSVVVQKQTPFAELFCYLEAKQIAERLNKAMEYLRDLVDAN